MARNPSGPPRGPIGAVYSLGETFCRAAGYLYRITLGALIRGIIFVAKAVARFVSGAYSLLRLSFIRYIGGWRRLIDRLKRADGEIRKEMSESRSAGITAFFRYVRYAMRIYRNHGKSVFNIVAPAVSAAAIIVLCVFASSYRLGVRVAIDGQRIADVPNENYFLSAANTADARLGADADAGVISRAEYTVVPVRRTGFTPQNEITDNIIRLVCGDNTRTACGVFVNDVFLCAMADENTFERVRTEVLDDYADIHGFDGSDTVVEFVDDIKTTPGLYPAGDIIKDAQWMRSYMKGYRSPAKYYAVKAGDTLQSILRANGLTEKQLRSYNPTQNVSDPEEGARLVVVPAKPNMSVRATVTYIEEESIPFETLRRSDPDLAIGFVSVIVQGAEGCDAISYTDTYIDGVLTDQKSEAIRLNVRAPANALIRVGTNTRSYAQTAGGMSAYSYLDSSSLYSVSPRLYKSQGGGFVWPAPDNCFYLSQGFSSSHKGIDIISSDEGSSRGRRIVAAADGVVSLVTYHWSWGYYVRVDHGGGIVTGYAHALEGSFKVVEGQYVTAGTQLSSIGTTGNSTGYHLHFEVWVDGTRVNPLPYVYDPVNGITVV